ncbi:MAG: phosphatidylserine decarboxylase family protein, partial [Bacteroidales bacterium]|nr:phosphatidylserine decarboxylase family protein [Bacteroidales bacterium]
MIRIHREGRTIVIITAVVLLVLVGLSARFFPYQVNYVTSILALIVLILVLRFFRIPHRRPFLDDKTITAPADGKVVAIERVQPGE